MVAPLNSPFTKNNLDDTSHLPPGDVPELHQNAMEQCIARFTEASQNRHGIGLLIIGEAGSGKSHMIAQMRERLAAIPNAMLACIPLKGAFAGTLWRHLRRQLVAELLKPYAPQHYAQGENGLLRILRNRFPHWAASVANRGGLMSWLLGRSRIDLRPHLDEFARTTPIDYAFRTVLPQINIESMAQLAFSWLQGEQLGKKDLEKLGLPPTHATEHEQERDAREVVLSFLRLAGERTTLFLCFDEVEAIQAGTYDAIVLRQFATMTTDLVGQAGPRVIATFIRTNLKLELDKAVEKSNLQKMGQFDTHLLTLTWEQSVRLVKARLEAEPTCSAARQAHGNNEFWPFQRAFLEDVFRKNKLSLTPRRLIMACQCEFERIQKGVPVEPVTELTVRPPKVDPRGTEHNGSTPPRKPPPNPRSTDVFQVAWVSYRNRLVDKLQSVQFDTVIGIGVPWLVELTQAPFELVEDADPRLGDINLVFRHRSHKRKPIGISFSNQVPTLLWRRLDRVIKQWMATKDGSLGSLFVLRFDPWPRTDAIKRRLEIMTKLGIQTISVPKQQYLDLATFQTILGFAQGGELNRVDGKPVDAAEYSEWAKSHLSEPVKEFFRNLFPAIVIPAKSEPVPV